MYLPYSEALGIYLQDDDFLERKPWDFENTPAEKYPLLLNYHPLVIYRHQVIKQADVVLAMFLLRDQFGAEEMKQTYDFYDPMTTGDSSLSVCIQGIVAAELRYMEKARQYARHALLMDLNDVAGNVSDGCHIASMGGTWMMLAQGLVGFRDAGGEFSFRPLRPHDFQDVRTRFKLRGNQLEVCIRDGEASYRLLSGPGLDFCHVDEPLSLTPDDPTAVRPCLRTA
jgi:alpha,alpha-trehalose phosphorylase